MCRTDALMPLEKHSGPIHYIWLTVNLEQRVNGHVLIFKVTREHFRSAFGKSVRSDLGSNAKIRLICVVFLSPSK
jgi:hypothetical protein